MPALGDDVGFVPLLIDCLTRNKDGGGGFYGKAADNGLTARNAAENSAGMIGHESGLAVGSASDFVGVFFSGELRCAHASTDLYALHRIDAHHRGGEILVQLGVYRGSKARGNAFGDHFDDRADGGTGFSHLIKILPPMYRRCGIGTEELVGIDRIPIPQRTIDGPTADLNERAADSDAVEHLACDRTCGNAHRSLTRRRAPATAKVADFVLLPVCVVRVARAELVLDV